MTRLSVRPVFVIGTARSGTTWIANLLTSHPAIAAVTAAEHHGIHESQLFSHTQYFFPEPLQFGDFINTYCQEDYFKLTGLGRSVLAPHLHIHAEIPAHFRFLMNEYARACGAQVWLEKSPRHAMYYRELMRYFPDARFVIIRRDFRDTLLSQLNIYARPDAPRWLQIAEKVFRYESDMRAMDRLIREARDRVVVVQYEDLREDQDREMDRVLAFLETDSQPLKSQFPPRSSFRPGVALQFRIRRFEWVGVNLLRRALGLLPFWLIYRIRTRRDRKQATYFPKYSLIASFPLDVSAEDQVRGTANQAVTQRSGRERSTGG